MKERDADIDCARATLDLEEKSPGLPWFRTWSGVYFFAFGCFVLYVVLLTIFSRAFS